MALQHRPMRPRDIDKCVELVAAHPVLGPRYGRVIADLRPAWLCLLQCEAKCAIVVEEVGAGNGEIWGIGVSAFVDDNFLRELKTPPLFWIGPELAKRTVRGHSPVLSGRRLQQANSSDGLNLVGWESYLRPDHEKIAEVTYRMMVAFVEGHSGYLWNEVIAAQAASVEHLQALVNCGGLVWNPKHARYTHPSQEELQELLRRPHVIGTTRELALTQPGSWVGGLFHYHAPKFGFSRSEQRLLLSAIAGGTDKELSDRLATSLSTVKKVWLSVYSRVSACLPDLFPGHCPLSESAVERGKEKRRHLLAYLREHPEELRPVSRKVLAKSAAQGSL